MTKTNVANINDFFTEDDLVVSDQIAYAMWFNPQKKVVGLGLDEEQAKIANFQPDASWQLKTITVGKEKKQLKVWVSESPRLVILNAVKGISRTVKGNAKPYYEYTFNKNGEEKVSKYSPLLFLIVGEDNQIISDVIVIRPKKACLVRFSQFISTIWTQRVLMFYEEEFGKTFGSEKPASSFYARHIFEGTFAVDDIENATGESSQAWVCTGNKPIKIENIFKLGTEEEKVVTNYVNNLPQILSSVARLDEIPAEEKPSEELADKYLNPETGEIELPPELMPF